MWVNAIQHGNKSLSPIEFLVLATVSSKFISAKNLLQQLETSTDHWIPDKGSIYPVLHRLSSRGLLTQSDTEKMTFKRATSGTNLLVNSLDSVVIQLEATVSFFDSVIESIVETDPIGSIKLLGEIKEIIIRLDKKVTKLESKAENMRDQHDWREIKIQ